MREGNRKILSIQFEITKEISAPPEFVFDWWTDLRPDDSELVKPLKKRTIISRTQDTIHLQDEEEMYFKRMTFDVTVALEPPLRWVSEYSGKSATARSEYLLTGMSNGTTTLSYKTKIEPNGFLTRTFSPLVTPFIKRVFESEMKIFIQTLEREFATSNVRN